MPKLKFSLIKDLRDLLDLYAEADSTIVKDRFHDLVCSAAFSDILFDLLDQNNDGHLDHHEITKTIEEKMGTTKDDDFTRFCAIFRDLISSYSGGYDVFTRLYPSPLPSLYTCRIGLNAQHYYDGFCITIS